MQSQIVIDTRLLNARHPVRTAAAAATSDYLNKLISLPNPDAAIGADERWPTDGWTAATGSAGRFGFDA